MDELLNRAIHPEMVLDELLGGYQECHLFSLLHFIYSDYVATKMSGLWLLIEGGRWDYTGNEYLFYYNLVKEWYHFRKQMPAPIKESQAEIKRYLKGD